MKSAAVALPDPRQPVGTHGDHSARLAEHDFGDRRGNFFAEQTKLIALLAVRPSCEFIGRRIMTEFSRTTAHDEAQHHLRVIALVAHSIGH